MRLHGLRFLLLPSRWLQFEPLKLVGFLRLRFLGSYSVVGRGPASKQHFQLHQEVNCGFKMSSPDCVGVQEFFDPQNS